MHAIDSILKLVFFYKKKNEFDFYLDKTNSDEKFNKLREEHIAVLHRV
jgi:hypothetical protein